MYDKTELSRINKELSRNKRGLEKERTGTEQKILLLFILFRWQHLSDENWQRQRVRIDQYRRAIITKLLHSSLIAVNC